jgi:hypothetical protein
MADAKLWRYCNDGDVLQGYLPAAKAAANFDIILKQKYFFKNYKLKLYLFIWLSFVLHVLILFL